MKLARKSRRSLRNWLPWRAFDGMGLDWRAHSDTVTRMTAQEARRQGLILLVLILVIATCAGALVMPRLSLVIDISGGLAVAAVVLFLTGQWQELRRGLAESGHWPSMDVQLLMIRQYVLETLLQVQERRRQRQRHLEDRAQQGEGEQ